MPRARLKHLHNPTTDVECMAFLASIQGRGVQVIGVPHGIREAARQELDRRGINWRLPVIKTAKEGAS